MATQKSMRLFLQWLSRNDPFLYEVALRGGQMLETEKAVAGLGLDWGSVASGIGEAFKTAVATVKDVLPAYAQYRAQSKVLKLQMERAQQGLPPLETEYYTPTVKVAPTITPETEESINRVAQQAVQQITAQTGAGIQKMILPIGLGIIGLLAFMLLRKKR